MKRVVIVHQSMGIYIGMIGGYGFFSNMDLAGQCRAATFENSEQARAHISEWDSQWNPDWFWYIAVNSKQWASIEDLDAAGLDGFTQPLKDERLMQMPTMGTA